MYHAMNNRNLFLTAAFAMVSMAVFAQVEIPEVKPKADSLQMAVDTLLLEGVTITAERPLYSVEGEKTLYQVSDDPTVQGGVASDALQNAPGVSVDVEGNITLRGTSSVEIWINDQPSNLTEENLKAWAASGVTAVGMGSKLFPKDVIAAGQWDSISRLCTQSLEWFRK